MKEARHKGLHIVGVHLYELSQKGRSIDQNLYQWLPGAEG